MLKIMENFGLFFQLTVEVFVVVLLRPQLVLDDEGIRGRKVCHCPGIELAT